MRSKEMTYPGLEGCLESLEWLWDTKFSCVASDSPGFEVWGQYLLIISILIQLLAESLVDTGLDGMEQIMHPTLLSGFVMPIGSFSTWRSYQDNVPKRADGPACSQARFSTSVAAWLVLPTPLP